MMANRFELDDNKIDEAVSQIIENLIEQMKKKGRGIFTSSHEILGVIAEEFDEMNDAVRANNIEELRKELLDLAVGALWGVASINSKQMDW